MLSLDKINETILELEQSDTSFSVCEKLAACYTVRDHLVSKQPKPKTGRLAGSEFLQAASGVDVAALLAVIDEHLQAVRVLYPEEYKAVVERVKAIKKG